MNDLLDLIISAGRNGYFNGLILVNMVITAVFFFLFLEQVDLHFPTVYVFLCTIGLNSVVTLIFPRIYEGL